jgi:hypothetical protein
MSGFLRAFRCWWRGEHGATFRETTDAHRLLICTDCQRTVAAMRRPDVIPFTATDTMKARPSQPATVTTFQKRSQ